MCEPVSTIATVASAAVTVGSDLLKAHAQNKEAAAVATQANQAAVNDNNALSEREAEERMAVAQAAGDAQSQTASATSIARLSAASAGVEGNSVNAILQSLEANRSAVVTSDQETLALKLQALENERLGVEATRESRINAAPKANPWATGLQIAGAGIDVLPAIFRDK